MLDRQRRAGGGPPGRLGVLAAAAAVALGVSVLPAGAAAGAIAKPDVDVAVYAELTAKGSAGFMVYLNGKADLSFAEKLTDSDSKAAFVYKELIGYAERSQQSLRRTLDAQKAQYRPYWIANAIYVFGDRPLLDRVVAHSDVRKVTPSKVYPLIQPTPAASTSGGASINAVEWNLTNIEAPRVWSEFGVRGEGIVVANIDTGVQYTHPALVGKYRGNLGNGQFNHNYNWFDPSRICGNPSLAPCDNAGHGSHTMGTMAGDDGAANQIGVAPGVTWMAAKGCEAATPPLFNECTDQALLQSAQWVLAPTDLNGQNPRPDLHADIVNNSWGGSGGDDWYMQSVDAWLAAGMFPQFSTGNGGPGCGSAGSPGDYLQSYAAGAYDINNAIASFSARGPGDFAGEIKPNLAAPGVNVRSSVPTNGYANFNGTSMASPHVAATVALIWSAAPTLKGNINATRALLDQSATDVDATTCGGTAADNNVFGEGRLNAYQAVLAAPRGANGRVVGVVTDAATSAPLAAALVTSGDISAITGPDGRYTLVLPVGEHTVTASKYGYATQSATVTVPEGAAVTQNFAMAAVPFVTVSGRVTDGSGKGFPLYAKIEINGRPGGPIFTNPANGRYSVQIASGSTYGFVTTVVYPGYQTVSENVAVGTSNLTHNIAVPVNPGCTAAGYAISFGAPILSETFDTTSTPAGWSVVNRTPSGGWVFEDLGNRGNLTGGTGGFAMIDSDRLGIGNTQDTDLIMPPLDLSAMADPHLRINHDYRPFSNSTADIDVSTDGGTTWVNVFRRTTTSDRGPRVETVPLTPAAGDADALVRFRYRGTWAWWWEVDNVQVVNRACNPVPGGLVVGFTNDRNTSSGLNGVTVTSDANPADKGVSAATPDDPNIGDGFYWLFSSAVGTQSFTATKPPYSPQTKSLNVVDNGTRQLNFSLAAPRLVVSPTSVEGFVPFGASRSTTVTVTNTGTAPAQVELTERSGTFEILNQPGAQLIMHKATGITKGKVSSTSAVSPSAATPLIDPAWTTIANYPAPTFDNSAATNEGKVYSVGGEDTPTEKKAYVYDPATESWAALPDMPGGRAKPAAAWVGGKLYVIGGWDIAGNPRATVDVYDPGSNSWSTLPATNPRPRATAGYGVANGKIYLVGGCVNAGCDASADLVIFDPASGSFSTGTSYPQLTSWTSCGGIDDRIYCAGGTAAVDHSNGFVYEPASDSWSPIANMPFDLWGSQFSAASGLLVLAGGVTGGSTTITNLSIAYDPAADAWINLPNAQVARFRGAGACGVYKVAGTPFPFAASQNAERLGGLDQCDGGDVPWLSETPEAFTLGAGKSRTVRITLTATGEAGIVQPGKYTAQLVVKAATPYPVSPVSVTMNVLPPPSWGKIQGTVMGQPCTGNPVPIPAFVRINLPDNPEIGASVKADAQGKYAWWLPAGTYQVIAAKDNWNPQVKMTRLDRGFINTVNFTLTPFTGCSSGGVQRAL